MPLEGEMDSLECSLCDVVKGGLLRWKVYEDNYILASLEGYPMSRGHVVVFTKKHYNTLTDMPPNETAHLFNAVAMLTRALKQAIKPGGINILQCNGECAWQNVPHVYVSIIPRSSGDKVRISYPCDKASNGVQGEVQLLITKELEKEVMIIA